MSKEAFDSGRVRQAVQDGSCEFISLLACVSAVGKRLPPALIYKGESSDLQDSWVEDLQIGDEAYFGSSSTGWSNDDFGLQWLEQVFDRYTRTLAGQRRRLLIVDGHSSYVNMAFLNKCDSLRILVLILLSYSTHRLQPLDVGLFGLLSTVYSVECNNYIARGLGYISLTKRLFWPIFKIAWDKSFTEDNIKSAFAKAGIWPVSYEIVQIITPRLLTPPETTLQLPLRLKTPLTSKSLRQLKAVYRQNPSPTKVELLFKATLKLSVQYSIDTQTTKGLVESLKIEKKKRSRGKRLNLVNEENSGAQFFSPTRIQKAREVQAEKASFEEAEIARKAQKKAEQECKRVLLLRLVAEKAIQRQLEKESQAQARTEKQAQKTLQAIEKRTKNQVPKAAAKKKTITTTPKVVPKAQKRSVQFVLPINKEVVVNSPKKLTSRGRVSTMPKRFT
jgi:hypothetical protein